MIVVVLGGGGIVVIWDDDACGVTICSDELYKGSDKPVATKVPFLCGGYQILQSILWCLIPHRFSAKAQRHLHKSDKYLHSLHRDSTLVLYCTSLI